MPRLPDSTPLPGPQPDHRGVEAPDGRLGPRAVQRYMRRLALVCLCLSSLARPIGAQGVTSPSPGPIVRTAAQIVRERWPIDPVSVVSADHGRPTFRSGVTADILPPPWRIDPDDRSPVPVGGAISHQEMLAVMTPRELSAPVVAIPGAGIDPGAVWHGITSAWRDWRARRIHARVTRELAALQEANRKDDEPTTDEPGGR